MFKFMSISYRPAAVATAFVLLAPLTSGAGIMATAEAPGVQSSTMANVVVETFNSRPVDSYTLIDSPIGTYTAGTPGAAVVAANAFGGANQTRYLAVGAQSDPTTFADLTFFGPQSYFGLYWGAVDDMNQLDFFSGSTLLMTFNRTNLSSMFQTTGGPFGTGHFGNPNTNENTGEPYAFLNFVGTDGTTFDRVRFRNLGTSTGFESDNHTISAVPEPSSIVTASLGGIGLLGLAHRGRRGRARAR